MSVAEAARAGARAHPFLLDALRAGVLNYSAAARFLELEDEAAGAAALRRLAEELSPLAPVAAERVRVDRGVGPVEGPEAATVSVGETHIGPDGGDWTAVTAAGIEQPRAAGTCLARLAAADVEPAAVGWDASRLVVVVDGGDVATAIRCLEGDVPGSTH